MLAFGTAKAKDGEEIGVYFDPQSKLIAGFEVLDTETMLGDVPAQYLFDDYRAVDGVMLPHRVTIRKGGKDYSDVRYARHHDQRSAGAEPSSPFLPRHRRKPTEPSRRRSTRRSR